MLYQSAVDLAQFHNKAPRVETGGVFHELTSPHIKTTITTGKNVACDDEKRTGNWVSYECTSDHVVDPLGYTPQQKWTALECDAAWDDTIRIYTGCCGRSEEGSFTRKVSAFLNMAENSDCDNLGQEASCDMQKCEVYRTANDKKSTHTGACAYLIWNSIASLHKMLKKYFYALQHAGGRLKDAKEQFITTFAPKPHDGTEILNLFLTLIPVPIGITGQRFIGGSLMKQAFFANDLSGNKGAELETATSGLLSAGSPIAMDVLKEASEARAEMSFNAIFDDIIGEWTRLTNLLVKRIFNGEDENIKVLTDLFRGGKMIGGKGDGGAKWDGDGDYTAIFNEEKAIERAFYAAAIPAAWAANRPTPVVVDFGPSCEIDARKYFIVGPEKYNAGWRCPDGHSYILAGVGDGPFDDCVHNLPNGPICPPSAPKPLEVLKGIEDIQETTNKWGGVTVDDLIIGAVKTYTANGKKNSMDRTSGISDFKDTTVMEGYNRKQVDVQRAGHIRIPVCGPEEIVGNIGKGRHFHENWLNYPCNP